jgi:NAD(P)-dependent dehydrogenase (short-subunit alcohol dehydrogenase family)
MSPTKHLMDLTGRVAVVIGGTSGLGRKLAVGLAFAGADVVPTGRREPLIEEACLEIERAGRKTLPASPSTAFATLCWPGSAASMCY